MRGRPVPEAVRTALNDQAAWLVDEVRRMGRPTGVCPCVMCRPARSPAADDDAVARVDNSGHQVVDGRVVGTVVERRN
jgi:hypothetical protein